MTITWSSIIKLNTKLNARLAIQQRADLFEANISANKIGPPQCQGYAKMVFTQLNTGPHKVKKVLYIGYPDVYNLTGGRA